MTQNILLLMGNSKGKLYVERHSWQKQCCTRIAAYVDDTHKQNVAAPPRTYTALVHAGRVAWVLV